MKFPFKSFLLIAAILVCAGFSTAFAQPQKFPAYTGHVNDFANVIDQQTEQKLETWLNNFEKLTGTQIAAVTVQSLEGWPVEEYANELYRAWGIGAKSGENRDKGALLIVALQDRKTRLETGYGLEADVPDGLAGEIIRRMRPSLQQGQYSQAMTTGVRTLLDTLAGKWNINIAGIEDRSYAYRAPAENEGLGAPGLAVLIGLFILFIIVMAIISRAGRRRIGGGNLWWLYPIIFNRGGGSFGGGSWGNTGGWSGGGSDSGSSGGSDWGGFGGGSSGGGGASDSW